MSKGTYPIQRILAAILAVFVLGFIVLTLSKVFSYYKISSQIVNVYDKVVSEFDHHHPHLKWLPDGENIVGKINPFLRKEIQSAYLKAWASSNLSIRDQKDLGLEEHFTDELRYKISQHLNEESAIHNQDSRNRNVKIESIDLNHEIELKFVSFDKQVVSFTDSNVKTLQRIGATNKTAVHESIYNYKVVMTLDDGKWRINKMIRGNIIKDSLAVQRDLFPINIAAIKGINYYPQKYPWKKFWGAFPVDTIEEDFKIINDLGFNTVRIFIPFNAFGGPHIQSAHLNKLDKLIEIAEKNNLKLMPTLFDFPVGFELLKYTGYDRHLKILLERYSDSKTIAAWDLKNEPDLDFQFHRKEYVLDWLEYIIKQAKKYDPHHPITIGWAHPENAHYLSDELDFVSFHYYLELSKLGEIAKNVQSQSPDKQILVSEYGMTSYDGLWPGSRSESEQTQYIAGVNEYLGKNRMGGILWSLYDYDEAPSDIFGWKPWIKASQKKFGIIKADGSQKPSAKQIKK